MYSSTCAVFFERRFLLGLQVFSQFVTLHYCVVCYLRFALKFYQPYKVEYTTRIQASVLANVRVSRFKFLKNLALLCLFALNIRCIVQCPRVHCISIQILEKSCVIVVVVVHCTVVVVIAWTIFDASLCIILYSVIKTNQNTVQACTGCILNSFKFSFFRSSRSRWSQSEQKVSQSGPERVENFVEMPLHCFENEMTVFGKFKC